MGHRLIFDAAAPLRPSSAISPVKLLGWHAENVPIPEQLRDPAGVKRLKELLRKKFARARNLQLHCIKLACRWPDWRSPYANLLGWLTTLGDVEALGYQWQGQKDKIHNADRLLKQVKMPAVCHATNKKQSLYVESAI